VVFILILPLEVIFFFLFFKLETRVNVITREPLEKLTFFELGSAAGSFNQNLFYFSGNLNGFLFDFNSEYGKPYDTGEGKKVTEYLTGTFSYQDRFIDKKAFDLKESSLKIR